MSRADMQDWDGLIRFWLNNPHPAFILLSARMLAVKNALMEYDAEKRTNLGRDGGQQDVIRTSLPLRLLPPHVPASSLLLISILLLLTIVFSFFCYLILLSSFSPLLLGAALLSIFVMRPGKKAGSNRNQQPFPSPQSPRCIPSLPLLRFLLSGALYSTSFCSICNSESLYFHTVFLNASTFHLSYV